MQVHPTRRSAITGLGALLPATAFGQGFAGLGAPADGFALPQRGRALVFPDDLGPHPEFRTEWWYVTANLTDADGRDWGVQWTLFRQALAPMRSEDSWADPHVWMGHAALTSATMHRFAERLARGGTGQAGAQADPFRAFIDDWSLERGGANTNEPNNDVWSMIAAGPDFAFRLSLTRAGPFVPQGEDGYSVKSATGQASHYFSQPFLAVEGALLLEGREIAVSGDAWLDREWSSQPLAPGQQGWDWLSLHLDRGEKLMAFALRSENAPAFLSGSWIAADGTPAPLAGADIQLTPLGARRVAGRRIPVRWRVRVPARGLDVILDPLNPGAWNPGTVPYWEGPVRADGTHPGRGYLEMTGY